MKRVLFYLPESSYTFPSDILVSLSLARLNRGVAEASWVRHGVEGGGVDVDKITLSSDHEVSWVYFSFFNLAFDTETESWLGILPSKVAS